MFQKVPGDTGKSEKEIKKSCSYLASTELSIEQILNKNLLNGNHRKYDPQDEMPVCAFSLLMSHTGILFRSKQEKDKEFSFPALSSSNDLSLSFQRIFLKLSSLHCSRTNLLVIPQIIQILLDLGRFAEAVLSAFLLFFYVYQGHHFWNMFVHTPGRLRSYCAVATLLVQPYYFSPFALWLLPISHMVLVESS